MDDTRLLHRISQLIGEEHELRSRVRDGTLTSQEEHAHLHELEVSLDQCWDLLRRRRAARDAGQDPAMERSRPPGEVEGYLQ